MMTTDCLYCDKPGTVQWTLSSSEVTGVAHLCLEHVAPIEEAARLAADRRPLVVKRKELVPMDWAPPSDELVAV